MTIKSGGLLQKDPNSQELYIMDWGAEHLSDTITISTSTWLVTGPDALLTTDDASILADNRRTQVRLTAGTLGAKYTVTNRIVTNESPAQTKDASFRVLVEEQ